MRVKAGHEADIEHGNWLGLWLVNRIVTRYGGSFQIGPGETTGTVAGITLPGLDPTDDPWAIVRPHTTLFQ